MLNLNQATVRLSDQQFISPEVAKRIHDREQNVVEVIGNLREKFPFIGLVEDIVATQRPINSTPYHRFDKNETTKVPSAHINLVSFYSVYSLMYDYGVTNTDTACKYFKDDSITDEKVLYAGYLTGLLHDLEQGPGHEEKNVEILALLSRTKTSGDEDLAHLTDIAWIVADGIEATALNPPHVADHPVAAVAGQTDLLTSFGDLYPIYGEHSMLVRAESLGGKLNPPRVLNAGDIVTAEQMKGQIGFLNGLIHSFKPTLPSLMERFPYVQDNQRITAFKHQQIVDALARNPQYELPFSEWYNWFANPDSSKQLPG